MQTMPTGYPTSALAPPPSHLQHDRRFSVALVASKALVGEIGSERRASNRPCSNTLGPGKKAVGGEDELTCPFPSLSASELLEISNEQGRSNERHSARLAAPVAGSAVVCSAVIGDPSPCGRLHWMNSLQCSPLPHM